MTQTTQIIQLSFGPSEDQYIDKMQSKMQSSDQQETVEKNSCGITRRVLPLEQTWVGLRMGRHAIERTMNHESSNHHVLKDQDYAFKTTL